MINESIGILITILGAIMLFSANDNIIQEREQLQQYSNTAWEKVFVGMKKLTFELQKWEQDLIFK